MYSEANTSVLLVDITQSPFQEFRKVAKHYAAHAPLDIIKAFHSKYCPVECIKCRCTGCQQNARTKRIDSSGAAQRSAADSGSVGDLPGGATASVQMDGEGA